MSDLRTYTWKNKPGIAPNGSENIQPFDAADIYAHIQKSIDKNSCYGIVGDNTTSSVEINKIAVQYMAASLKGDEIELSYRVLKTPCGQIVQSMIDNDINLEHRVQAVGIVEKGVPTLISFISFKLEPT